MRKLELIEEFLKNRNWRESLNDKPTKQDKLIALQSDIDRLCRKITVKWNLKYVAELDYLILCYNFISRSEEDNMLIFEYTHRKKMAELEFEEKMRLF